MAMVKVGVDSNKIIIIINEHITTKMCKTSIKQTNFLFSNLLKYYF